MAGQASTVMIEVKSPNPSIPAAPARNQMPVIAAYRPRKMPPMASHDLRWIIHGMRRKTNRLGCLRSQMSRTAVMRRNATAMNGAAVVTSVLVLPVMRRSSAASAPAPAATDLVHR